MIDAPNDMMSDLKKTSKSIMVELKNNQTLNYQDLKSDPTLTTAKFTIVLLTYT